jgi:hypothetical protein
MIASKLTRRNFFRRNLTLARVDIVDDNKNVGVSRVPVRSTTAPSKLLPPGLAAAMASSNPPPEKFYAQLIKTMKNIQAPQQLTKLVVESRDHEETIDPSRSSRPGDATADVRNR